MKSHDLDFDGPLTADEQARADRLCAEDIALIDGALLSNVAVNWRKLASVVAKTMDSTEGKLVGVPDLFYAQRVMVLAKSGAVESQGDLRRMRYSEVRLPLKPGELK
jgi:hypothetical protein